MINPPPPPSLRIKKIHFQGLLFLKQKMRMKERKSSKNELATQ